MRRKGRAGAVRRKKTVVIFHLYTYICIYKEEGAEREPVGGEDGSHFFILFVCIYVIIRRKGPRESR